MTDRRIHLIVLVLTAACLNFAGCKKNDERVAADDLPDLTKQTRSYVTVEPTRVRTGPGNQFRTIAEIPPKARVYAVGRDGEWLLIVSKKGNAPGYIESAAAKAGEGEEAEIKDKPAVEGKYQTIAVTQVHSGPGLHYPLVSEISRGTIVNVVNEENGWLKIESKRGNKPGYVDASMLKPMTSKQSAK
jgi:uncharacterized protein YgiM (DUF1202 family)